MRRCVRRCTLLFGTLLLSVSMLSMSSPVQMKVQAAYTNALIQEKQSQVQSSKQQREQIQQSLSDVKRMKEALEASKADLTAYITQLDANLTQIQLNIDTLKQQMEDKQAEIDKTQEELNEAIDTQTRQYEAMKQRIKFLYEKGDTYYLEIFLNTTTSFSELLNKMSYANQISDYDDRLYQMYQEQTELVRVTKEALEEEYVTLDETKQGVEAEERSMQELLAEKEQQLNQMKAQIAAQENSIADYEDQVAKWDAEIAALENAIRAEEARLAAEAAAKRYYTGGVFTWPCPGYSSISSDYGYRIHPIYGTQRFHSGIDMAASYGTPILAAYAGQVVAASYDASMGNYVMISHGDTLFTVYMHCSALYVSKGQEVSAGQKIASVGSTGASTGPHLHFSVRKNGQYVSPWPYLGS